MSAPSAITVGTEVGLLKNLRLSGGHRAQLAIREGRFESGPAAAGGFVLDCAEHIALPAFVDTHLHLDKALTRSELAEHDGTLPSAIAASQERKRRYTEDDVRKRAKEVIRSHVRHGTTRIRSHVDVDTIGGLVPLAGVLLAAQDCRQLAEVLTIAFPQEGILSDPGTAQLMRSALEMGCDLVGGMPHWERTPKDQLEHVRYCFDLAEEFDRDLDLHVDETDDGAVRTLEMVADEALARGWEGRVTAGHVCSLSAADEAYAKRVIDKCRQAKMTIVSNPATNLMIQGRADRGLIRRGTTRIRELREAGINLCFGQDCVHDGFYPFGRGDMLEVALISAHAAQLGTTEELDFALRAVTENPARAWRLDAYGIQEGARADLAIYAASSWEEALRLQLRPAIVLFEGRVVATNHLESALALSEG
ncbi:MAG: amidohydrolase family protein [Candidatus Dormibacteraeota bacterium]|nr:amidohydrolase family protein [Candidatus Dormibacteraeota bacterium]